MGRNLTTENRKQLLDWIRYENEHRQSKITIAIAIKALQRIPYRTATPKDVLESCYIGDYDTTAKFWQDRIELELELEDGLPIERARQLARMIETETYRLADFREDLGKMSHRRRRNCDLYIEVDGCWFFSTY